MDVLLLFKSFLSMSDFPQREEKKRDPKNKEGGERKGKERTKSSWLLLLTFSSSVSSMSWRVVSTMRQSVISLSNLGVQDGL